MLDKQEVGKRGYLNEGFRLFRLKDSRAQQLEYHYHEFDKLILFLGGKVTYVVEGVTYFLKPWDVRRISMTPRRQKEFWRKKSLKLWNLRKNPM